MTRKNELTQALIAYLIRHGLADLSLRPLAAGAGTSARLLVYHFGSKEGLLADVLSAMQVHVHQAAIGMLDKSKTQSDSPRLLRRFWDWAIAEPNASYLKLLYELQILAVQAPDTYGPYLQRDAAKSLSLTLSLMSSPMRSASMATLCIAVFDGLFLDFITTGDRARTTAALDQFIKLATAAPPPPAARKKTRKAKP
jgi:AcrR family transcriptional regulator